MAVYGGPDIVTDGLVLCLDAANKKSNNGSENILYDLSNNNNNGTLFRSSTTPLEIANCVCWWDASDSSTLFESNTGSTLATSTIGRWANKGTLGSSADLLQSTSNKRPSISTNIFNGLQSVLFDGIDDALVRSFTLDSSCHIFAVLKWPNPFSSIVRATDGATVNTLSFVRSSSTSVGIIGSAPTSLSSTIDTSGPLIFEAAKNTTNSRFVINGAIQSTGNLDTTSPNGITLGSFGGGTQSYDNVSFAEVVVYSDPLSVEDASKVSSYLAAKWAIPNYATANYFDLNGSNNYISIPHSSSINFGSQNFSIGMWIKIPSSASNQYTRLIDKNYLNGFSLMLNINNYLQFEVNGNNQKVIYSGQQYRDNIWHNIHVVRSGSTVASIYVDGLLKVTGSIVGGTMTSTTNIGIGSEFDGSVRFLQCNIGKVLLYNQDLTPKQIMDNYKALKGRYGL